MSRIAPLALSLSLLALSSCRHLSGRPESVDLIGDPASAPQVVKDLIQLEEDYDDATDPAVQRSVRDRFARKFIQLTDQRFNEFLDDLVMQRKGFDSTADVTAIGLDTASVLFTPASTKSILAGLAGLTTAAKTSINKVYFYEQALPALLSRMMADRLAVLADIHAGLKQDDVSYPLHRLLTDLQRYYQVGTIDGALQQIQRDAGETTTKAEAELRLAAKNDIDQAKSRREAARSALRNAGAFDPMRRRVLGWWTGLDEDARAIEADVLIESARSTGADVATFQNAPFEIQAFLAALQKSRAPDLEFLAHAYSIADFDTDGTWVRGLTGGAP